MTQNKDTKSRWQKAKKAELQHYTETANLQVVSENRASDILKRWNRSFNDFDGQRVLAVGGGTGIIHHLSNAEFAITLDPLNNSVFPKIRDESTAMGITGTGEQLPFPDNFFDIVISANVIDHTANPSRVLSEIARVMDTDGEFLFDVNIFRARRWGRKLANHLDRPHPHHFDSIDIQELLLKEFEKIELTTLKRIPFDASPSITGRVKIFVANVVFGYAFTPRTQQRVRSEFVKSSRCFERFA